MSVAQIWTENSSVNIVRPIQKSGPLELKDTDSCSQLLSPCHMVTGGRWERHFPVFTDAGILRLELDPRFWELCSSVFIPTLTLHPYPVSPKSWCLIQIPCQFHNYFSPNPERQLFVLVSLFTTHMLPTSPLLSCTEVKLFPNLLAANQCLPPLTPHPQWHTHTSSGSEKMTKTFF